MSKNEMVNVQATIEALEEAYAGDGALDFMNDAAQFLRQFQAQPADHSEQSLEMVSEQHQVEPVALPMRRSWSGIAGWKDQAEIKAWNACLDEIAKLGPLYTHADPGEVDLLQYQVRLLQAQLDLSVSAVNDLAVNMAERDALLRDLIQIAEDREQGYAERQHGGVVNGRAADGLVALLGRMKAALSASAEPSQGYDK